MGLMVFRYIPVQLPYLALCRGTDSMNQMGTRVSIYETVPERGIKGVRLPSLIVSSSSPEPESKNDQRQDADSD